METKTYKKSVIELYTEAAEKVIQSNVKTQQMSISGNQFKGLNNSILALSKEENGFRSDTWFTEKQMQELQLAIKDDAEATIIFSTFLKDINGKKELALRYYKVFNKDQVEKIPL